jgi:hypothetical protein
MTQNLRMLSSPTHPPNYKTNPEAMVVKFGNAGFAKLAMFGSERLYNLAIIAKPALRQSVFLLDRVNVADSLVILFDSYV